MSDWKRVELERHGEIGPCIAGSFRHNISPGDGREFEIYVPKSELDEAIEGCERLTREREEARHGEDEFKATFEGFKERLSQWAKDGVECENKLRDMAREGNDSISALAHAEAADVYNALLQVIAADAEFEAASGNPESTE